MSIGSLVQYKNDARGTVGLVCSNKLILLSYGSDYCLYGDGKVTIEFLLFWEKFPPEK